MTLFLAPIRRGASRVLLVYPGRSDQEKDVLTFHVDDQLTDRIITIQAVLIPMDTSDNYRIDELFEMVFASQGGGYGLRYMFGFKKRR